ncbi:MAG: homocysteine S-methyltransferase family protein [Acutalibacter sp.]|jgi:5-methyltetrahydrofolate--homocysteine methyltransferase
MNLVLSQLGDKIRYFDGAMGTILQEKGLQPGELPELWGLTHREELIEIHRSYLQAGADFLKSNTFGANRFKLEGTGHTVEEVVTAGIENALQAAEDCGKGIVFLDIGPTGKLLQPLGELAFEDAVSAFGEMVRVGTLAGAQAILIETMTDIYEAKAALLAAKENSDLPVFVTMTFDQDGKLLTGGDLTVAAAVLEGLGADAIGFNCGLGPEQMASLLPKLRETTGLPIVVNPNAGLPVERDGKTCFDVGPQEFAGWMGEIARGGAWVVGGCCGTTPQHIQAMTEACRGLRCQPLPNPARTVVTSGIRSVEFGGRPVIIGERINPTGKAKFKQALRDHDIPYVLREGIAQQDAGAHVLDVNVGLPEIDEPTLMCEVIQELQAVSPLPLQIDTSDPVTMEKAMRLYNGKPLVNSVTAKTASMKAIFPLVKKYGGVVIGLTITEEGIPETAEGRFLAARRIVQTALTYGIRRCDIIIDPLTMAVSAGQDAALVTLEALERIHKELGVKTSLGVSNVSFGLPQRENITSAFFLMALQRGLHAAIMNPKSDQMMRAYRSFCVLAGWDVNCTDYIDAYGQEPTRVVSSAPAGTEYTLQEAIEKGLKDAAHQAAEKGIASRTGLELINQEIVPALDAVGDRFEKKTLFLPQLLMSAEAAKAAFDVIKSHLQGGEENTQRSRLTIVIATVKGDVHDIGKNIVKVLLENYGFHVIDLGKDVPPKTVVDTAKKENAQLVGLSALMTTTVVNMKETIELLRKELPQVKVMVGGAVLTQEYADSIGADFYGKDAMASVRYASDLAESL